jgi:hypothetical protein
VSDLTLLDDLNGRITPEGVAGSSAQHDPALDRVEEWFRARSAEFEPLYPKTIRQALDEVIDGGRTGRWSYSQLEKTEKTYVGTKIEILFRAALELPRQKPLDTVVEGYPVDIKWSRSSWQIPTEAVEQICLLVAGDEARATFEVGLLRCRESLLNLGKNKDGKRTISQLGRSQIRWLARGTLPPNFLATLPAATRDAIMSAPPGQPRVTKLFTLVQKTPVPRLAIVTLAQQPGDPMRRIRRDKSDRLHGLVVLGGHYKRPNSLVQALGFPPLAKDEYMSVPRADIARLGLQVADD